MSRTSWSVASPDERLDVRIDGPPDAETGRLTYSVTLDGVVLVEPSPLGLVHSGGRLDDIKVVETHGPTDGLERYSLVHGKQLSVSSPYREISVDIAGSNGATGGITFRVNDSGAAFRYRIDLPDGETEILARELTGFTIPEGRAWIQPHEEPGWATPAYEAAYANGIPSGSPTDAPSWNMPALFEHDGHWLLLAEADLGPHAFGAHLSAQPEDRCYLIVPPEPGEAEGIGEVWPTVTDGWLSPWRVIIGGDSLAAVVESTLITDLALPPRFEDTDWIRPGRVSWSWWSDHNSPKSLDALRRYVDFAADMGWEHTLVDANWTVHDDAAMADLVAYAAERGVGVFLWYNSGGPNNIVTEAPRDRMFEADVRRREFARLAGWGVAGVKVDFFHSDKPEGIARMWDILANAAQHRVMVNLHGCTVPRGWQRTWPHLMTMEGVRGAEQYAFVDTYPETAVWHNTVLPYTRNAVGPMDYTPVTLSDQRYPHLTTAAHELALAVLYESALQHYADSIESYRNLPDGILEMLRRIPAVWDETRHVTGYPGSHAVMARRAVGRWYVAGIAGPDPVEVAFEVGLISPRPVTLITDGPAGPEIGTVVPDPQGMLRIAMKAAGGFVAEVGG